MIDWKNKTWKIYISSIDSQFNLLLIIDYSTSNYKNDLNHELNKLDVELNSKRFNIHFEIS